MLRAFFRCLFHRCDYYREYLNGVPDCLGHAEYHCLRGKLARLDRDAIYQLLAVDGIAGLTLKKMGEFQSRLRV